MSVEASRARAREAAAKLPHVPGDVSELLRADAVALCTRLPEPPVYRRRDDPARAAAEAAIPECEALLARAFQANDAAWTAALDAWLTTLHQIAAGKVELAEASWVDAQRLEQLASGRRRLYAASDEVRAKVFDAQSRQSRFDPRPEKSMTVKVPCPSCRKVSEISFSPRVATHQLKCTHCAAEWAAYFGEVRSLEIQRRGNKRRYSFRLTELGGPQTRVEVEDTSVGELQVARNDLVAFLYLPKSVLRGVLNLSSSRVLWLSSGGPCFVATVAFGEDARELDVLRAFRDRRLMRSAAGRGLVDAYYTHGPRLAREVLKRRWLKRTTRLALSTIVRLLERPDV